MATRILPGATPAPAPTPGDSATPHDQAPYKPHPHRGKRQYYTPAAAILDVPGVSKEVGDWVFDCYVGSAQALVQAGLASLDMFPGQPGRPLTSATYAPSGCDLTKYRHTPGYLTIFRRADGNFRIQLTVSAEEQARRAAAGKEKEAREREAYQQAMANRDMERLCFSNQFKAGGRARVYDSSNKGVLVAIAEPHGLKDGYVTWVVHAVRDPLIDGQGQELREAICSSAILRPIDLRVIQGGRAMQLEASHA